MRVHSITSRQEELLLHGEKSSLSQRTRKTNPWPVLWRRNPPRLLTTSTKSIDSPSGRTAAMASGGHEGNALPPAAAAAAAPARECESCRSAPGIPFCRVEWSFLCAGCAAVIHCHNYVVAVTPNPNPTPAPARGPVVQVSSGEDEPSPSSGGRRGGLRRGVERGPLRRAESVMRYREKRKSRMFEKTVRYETRKAYADSRPRVDGKFVRREGTETEASPSAEGPLGARGGAVMTDGEVGEARGGDDTRQLGVEEEAAGPK